MDMSSGEWLSHLGMEDPTTAINQCQMTMLLSSEAHSNGDNGFNNLFDPTANMFNFDNTQMTVNNFGVKSEILDVEAASCPPSSGQIISFGSSNRNGDGAIDLSKNTTVEKGKKRSVGAISTTCSQEHVLAERKRREKMTQRFLALSALIPGLSKMDKASVLGDAAKYLKELESRVKLLEEQTATRTIEYVALVKTVKDPNLDDGKSSLQENNCFTHSMNPLLEIEARASNKNVLVRIHSQKNQGLVQKALNEIEKLNLTTLTCQTMPFGGYAMNITIIAQMNDDVRMNMKDLVLYLKQALQ